MKEVKIGNTSRAKRKASKYGGRPPPAWLDKNALHADEFFQKRYPKKEDKITQFWITRRSSLLGPIDRTH